MSNDQSSQDILRTVWSVFKEILKYLLLYLVFYAILKALIMEVLAYDNEGVVALTALIPTLLIYYLIKRRSS
ncbi:MAG: hypothetical protein K9N46_10575 [Candidatus Marinimicrobia bacterium]|nr:hypothetical protein [Candidatus Neomarinimicrobiota bacterium]MCF7829176.1 hypothetical protein [Candidatus Neomarinimicrobiota bacterium]MCF7881171.1 hypothetical protein [Candidatus Neomarinimicrobiota bacterium]